MSDPADLQRLLGDMIRIGTVESIDHEAATCRLRIGELVTGDLPIGSARAGGTTIWSPATEGEQRLLFCPEGDIEAGVLGPAIYSEANAAPGNRADLDLMQFSDGAILSYDSAAHRLEATLPDGATVAIVATGGVTLDASQGGLSIKGDVAIDGNVTITGTADAEGDVTGEGISLAHHTHPGVAAGSATTGEPV